LSVPKQAVGMGPVCPKTSSALISAMGSFWKLYGWNQHEKHVKMAYKYVFVQAKSADLPFKLGGAYYYNNITFWTVIYG